MTERSSLFSYLWTPSRRRVSQELGVDAGEAVSRLGEALGSSDEVTGRVAGRGVKIERHPSRASQRGAFAPVFYGMIREDAEKCLLVGHFQLHPVGRLYIAAWTGLSTLLALALLGAGFLRATPESTAQDALPFLLPVLLPFLGMGVAHWRRQKGKPDEAAIRQWLDGI